MSENSSGTLSPELSEKLARVRGHLQQAFASAPANEDVCITCSFQAEDVLLLKLALELRPEIPTLFLDTGYHFAETYAYRDQIAEAWKVNLINLLPAKTVAEQEAEFGLLYQQSPDRCCGLRKVEPLFRAVAGYKIWFTGLRREQAKSRAALEESAPFTLPGGQQVLKVSPLADWTTKDVWYACQHYGIPLLSLYDKGYSSIGCEPCTFLPSDPNDPRSGRWGGRKVECGIHIQAAPAQS
ncbi:MULTISPECIES: phosphoadenylyl-sulfate reductase [Acidobacterium]|uniref:phosphoadenylyl-sulfate reductase n=1 Tax=Acidobacterium TaxID=33973 RepID=UPI0002D75451|nr:MULTISPECIES: phosphoadenylyl-sulfate reductase [Acidobacterium]HCT59687.1 phosphoadenylyl-sulfate reductase [Acidobacterium sp.]